MNKEYRKQQGLNKYKKRLKNYGFTSGHYYLKTTGRPCSCAMCSPSKVQEKAKYRLMK